MATGAAAGRTGLFSIDDEGFANTAQQFDRAKLTSHPWFADWWA